MTLYSIDIRLTLVFIFLISTKEISTWRDRVYCLFPNEVCQFRNLFYSQMSYQIDIAFTNECSSISNYIVSLMRQKKQYRQFRI